jgi:hypothetical protein
MGWGNITTTIINDLQLKCQSQTLSHDKQLKAYSVTIERLIEHIQWFRKNKAQLIDTNEKSKKRGINTNLTRRITAVLASSQPNLDVVTEILAIKKEMDELKGTIKKDILQQQMAAMNDVLSDITATSIIPVKKLITILQCMHGICEDKMWSDISINARKMIVKYINSALSASETWTETMTNDDRLHLTSAVAMIYSLISTLAENSNIGIKRDIVNNDNSSIIKRKRSTTHNWYL